MEQRSSGEATSLSAIQNLYLLSSVNFSTYVFYSRMLSESRWIQNFVLFTVYLGSILVNNQLDAQFFFRIYLFIPILYMFQAPLYSSSGESVVLIQCLVYVTVCRWPSSVQVWMELLFHPKLHTGRSHTYE